MSELLSLLKTLSRAAFRCELALIAFLSIAAIGVSLPSSLVVELDEAAWPVESEDEPQEGEEESVAQGTRQFELRRQGSVDRSRATQVRQPLCLSRPMPLETKAGHRLPNGLMAPPRC
jgi:hypothetical protein